MSFMTLAFYGFALITTLAALGVVSVRNPVHAVLLLVLTFFSTACLWLLLQAEFLGIALVLVYIGAVMVLFLFVVMMLDVHTDPLREGFARHLPLALVVAAVMGFEVIALVGVRRLDQSFAGADPAASVPGGNVAWVGKALFSEYLLPFEVASVILTVAIIAAIAIALRRRPGTKHQDPSRQVQVRAADRVRLVKMPAASREEKSA